MSGPTHYGLPRQCHLFFARVRAKRPFSARFEVSTARSAIGNKIKTKETSRRERRSSELFDTLFSTPRLCGLALSSASPTRLRPRATRAARRYVSTCLVGLPPGASGALHCRQLYVLKKSRETQKHMEKNTHEYTHESHAFPKDTLSQLTLTLARAR